MIIFSIIFHIFQIRLVLGGEGEFSDLDPSLFLLAGEFEAIVDHFLVHLTEL